jgi:hypothetical protein
MHSGTGVWTDQAGPWIPAVSVTRVGESTRRVGTDLHDSQSSEVSQDVFWIKRGRSAKEYPKLQGNTPEPLNHRSGPLITGPAQHRVEPLGLIRAKDPASQLKFSDKLLGEKDKAFEWLEKGYGDRSIFAIKADPIYDSLRSDPRWADLLRRMNLQP